MRVIDVDQPGEADVLRICERPRPEPGPGELLVRVVAAGVNRADILQRRGLYPPPPGESDVLGLEVAGEVVATGSDTTRFQQGDRVFGLVAGGGYAEFCLLHESLALPVPNNWDFPTAAAVAEVFFTAHEHLFEMANLQAGETVLIHAGGSGVGSAAIQLARTAGARVLTTAGSEEKCQRSQDLGAHLAINYKSQDFVEICLANTNDRGVDVVLDFIGAKYLQQHLKVLAPKGRLQVVGLLGGVEATLNLAIILKKALRIQGAVMRSLPLAAKAAIRARFEQRWWAALEDGRIQPIVDQCFELTNATAAHRHMEASQHFGKILLIP